MALNPGIARSSAIVAGGSVLGRATGLLSWWVLLRLVGNSNRLSDAYHAANNLPNILYELLAGGVLSAALIPLFVERLDEEDHEGVSVVVTVSVVALAALTALCVLSAPLIGWLFSRNVSGVDTEDYTEAVTRLLVWFLPQIFFYGLVTVVTALLNARRRFAAAALAPMVNNVVVVALLFAAGRFTDIDPNSTTPLSDAMSSPGTMAYLGLATTAGVVASALVLLPALRGGGFELRFRFDLRHPLLRRLAHLSGWMVGYVIANQITTLTIIQIANLGEGGTISSYDNAYRFFVVPHGLLAVSLITALLPEQARSVVRGDHKGLRRQYATGWRMTSLIMFPAAVSLVLLGTPVADLLAAERDARDLAPVLIAFGAGLPSFSLYLYALRVFYAHKDTRTPFRLNAIENVCQIVLSLVLGIAFGAVGLAAAHSVAYTIAAVLAFRAANLRLASVPVSAVRPVLGMAAAALMTVTVGGAALTLLGSGGRDPAAVVRLVVGGTVLCVAYPLYLWLFRTTADLEWVLSRVRAALDRSGGSSLRPSGPPPGSASGVVGDAR